MLRLGRHRTALAKEVVGEPVAEAPYELAAIGLLTTGGPRTGWIATEGERTSDWINQREELPIHSLADTDSAADHADLPTGTLGCIPRDDIIWAVPPPLPPNRHLRLHRRRVRVNLELEAYEVTGQVHVRPGADATDHLLRGARVMVPLTEVEVVSRTDPADRTFWPVLIVNTTHVHRIVTRSESSATTAPAPLDPTSATTGVDPPVRPPGTNAPVGRATIALRVLLDEGIVDLDEFQAMLARIPVPAR